MLKKCSIFSVVTIAIISSIPSFTKADDAANAQHRTLSERLEFINQRLSLAPVAARQIIRVTSKREIEVDGPGSAIQVGFAGALMRAGECLPVRGSYRAVVYCYGAYAEHEECVYAGSDSAQSEVLLNLQFKDHNTCNEVADELGKLVRAVATSSTR